jgi:hypothetical protein
MVAGTLLVLASGCLAIGLRGLQRSPPVPQTTPVTLAVSGGTPTAVTSAAPMATAAAARSTPVILRIPAIGVAVSVSAFGLNPDGNVEVPTDYQLPGWFRLGPTPGQRGSAVILGHVDSFAGPAVFFRLRSLRAGDKVEVVLADSTVTHSAVTDVVMYPKDELPAQVVHGSHGYSAPQLVTCGGTFDSRSHSYLTNVVTFTRLVATVRTSPTPATGAEVTAAGSPRPRHPPASERGPHVSCQKVLVRLSVAGRPSGS